MKASELMINDWVWSDILQRPCQVGRPSDFRFMYAKRYDVFDKDGEFKHITPISLTEKILEANGIKYQFGSPWWQAADPFGNPDQFEVHINKVTTVIVCYVHQIQQALRLCGLNDLADNFKIE